MSNVWVTSGSSYLTAATLGNMLAKKIRVVGYINVATTGVGYLYGQASSTLREFGLYITDTSGSRTIDFTWGGTFKSIGLVTTVFGSATPAGIFDFEADPAEGTYALKLNGTTVSSGPFAAGTQRYDATLWRFGARSNVGGASSTTGAYIVPAEWKFGDQQIFLDDVLVRSYVMPVSGTNIPESVSSAVGTLRVPDGTDFEVVAGADTTPDTGSFGSVANVTVSTVTQLPNAVTVLGVDAGVDISATPGSGTEFRISTNGGSSYGSWLTTTTNVRLGYLIQARKTSSSSHNASITATVTVGGVAFNGTITTASLYPIKNIIIIGASIEYRPYGRSLVTPSAAGTAALVAAGLEGVNLYSNAWDGYSASQLVSKIEEAVAAFPGDDTLFMCHPFGNDVSNTRPYSSMTAGEISAFQTNVANCMAAFGAARNRAYFAGISFRAYANPRTDKTIFNDQSLGSLPYYENFIKPYMLPHELNTNGFPVYDLYNFFRNNCESILDDDGIHELNPAGYVAVREFNAQVFKSLIVDGVKPAVIIPAEPLVPPVMPGARSVTVTEGTSLLGTFAATSGTSPITYSIDLASQTLFAVTLESAVITFKALAVEGTGAITITATNSYGSASQVITYTVEAAEVEEPTTGILSVNGGMPIAVGDAFFIDLFDVNAADVSMVRLIQPGIDRLIQCTAVSGSRVSAEAPTDLANDHVTVVVYENKAARIARGN